MPNIDDTLTHAANLSFVKRSMRQPMLTREHEQDLARRWRNDNDERALHELVTAYGRLVIGNASRFRHYGLPFADLMQEGHIGLLQAAARFDPEHNVRFSTYASWWVRSAMQDFVLRNWSIVRTGTTSAQKSLFFNLRRLRAKIARAGGNRLSEEGVAEVATALKVKPKDVEMMESRLAASDQSLNATLTDESESERIDLLEDNRPGPEDVVIGMRDAETRSAWLKDALEELSPRERQIIKSRRLREDGATLEELGRELGVSKERVRQLESRALDKMRKAIERRGDVHMDLIDA